jgi:NAD(P)-dependent dehydrogenase (short-subunit alcohol dehydrogenase family)
MIKTRNKAAVITGGGSGIGLHLARHFAALEWEVAICGRDQKTLEIAAEGIEQEFQVDCFWKVADVSNERQMEEFSKAVEQEFKQIDLVVCNAAVLGPVGELIDISIKELRESLAINVIGQLATLKAFWSAMSAAASPRAIVVSGGGLGADSQLSNALGYVPSKAAMATIVELLAPEFEKIGGAVISVAPSGLIPTNFLENVREVGEKRAGKFLYKQSVDQQIGSIDELLVGFVSLIEFLLTENGKAFNGCLLSAKWNPVAQLFREANECLGTSKYRLRRIDDQLFRSNL